MRRNIILIICIFLFILSNIFLPTTQAEKFEIGKKVSETSEGAWGDQWYYFDSGCVVETKSDKIDFVPLLFDGNLSTGLNKFLGKNLGTLNIDVLFPTPIFVNNITLKPTFGGKTSSISFEIGYDNRLTLAWKIDEEKTFQINCLINAVYLDIFEENVFGGNGTGYYIFNDVIINCTPSSINLNDIQKQINKINQDINSIYNDIIVLKDDIIDIKANITDIKMNMPSEYNDSALKDQINNLTQEINSLKEDLTRINNSIHSKYNDSAIKSNIFSIETENIFLKQQIGNLTIRINNLTTELEKLSSEVQNLQGVSGEKSNDTEQNYRISEYTYPIIFGIIIIILLLIILKLSLTILKRKHHDIEEPRSEDILISKIKYDILTNKEIKDSRLYDDEYKRLLENGYQKGEMSQETYNYIKTVLEVSEKPQNLKDKKS